MWPSLAFFSFSFFFLLLLLPSRASSSFSVEVTLPTNVPRLEVGHQGGDFGPVRVRHGFVVVFVPVPGRSFRVFRALSSTDSGRSFFAQG